MKLAPGFYKTRDGSKAEVVGRDHRGNWLGWCRYNPPSTKVMWWLPEGKHPQGEVAWDLIAPWTDEPVESEAEGEWLYFCIQQGMPPSTRIPYSYEEYQKFTPSNDAHKWLRIKAERVK